MPDPAVDAARLGLPYTEPRGHGLNARLKSKAKITFEHDPNNPYAPPKRIIEKMGFWERVIGPKSDTIPTVKYTPAHQQSIWSTNPRPLPPVETSNQIGVGTTAYRLTPFPSDFGYLPTEERKAWEKQRKEEIKFLRALEKEQKAAEGAEEARKEREFKVTKKQHEDEIKARKHAIKLEKKLGYRPMPEYIPPKYPTHRPLPSITQQLHSPTPMTGPGQPNSWMLLPTLEQFGVMRPFDAPGQVPDKIHNIGGTEWPMMSRTMTHAMLDMSREERVHLDQAGHSWSPAWYRD